jgi:hypothetical protein
LHPISSLHSFRQFQSLTAHFHENRPAGRNPPVPPHLLLLSAFLFAAFVFLNQQPPDRQTALALGGDGHACDAVFVSRPNADYGSFYVRDSAQFSGVGWATAWLDARLGWQIML